MKVQQALMPLGFRLRAVKKEEYGLPVGVLLGELITVYTAGSGTGLAAAAVCGAALDLGLGLPVPMTAVFCAT